MTPRTRQDSPTTAGRGVLRERESDRLHRHPHGDLEAQVGVQATVNVLVCAFALLQVEGGLRVRELVAVAAAVAREFSQRAVWSAGLTVGALARTCAPTLPTQSDSRPSTCTVNADGFGGEHTCRGAWRRVGVTVSPDPILVSSERIAPGTALGRRGRAADLEEQFAPLPLKTGVVVDDLIFSTATSICWLFVLVSVRRCVVCCPPATAST